MPNHVLCCVVRILGALRGNLITFESLSETYILLSVISLAFLVGLVLLILGLFVLLKVVLRNSIELIRIFWTFMEDSLAQVHSRADSHLEQSRTEPDSSRKKGDQSNERKNKNTEMPSCGKTRGPSYGRNNDQPRKEQTNERHTRILPCWPRGNNTSQKSDRDASEEENEVLKRDIECYKEIIGELQNCVEDLHIKNQTILIEKNTFKDLLYQKEIMLEKVNLRLGAWASAAAKAGKEQMDDMSTPNGPRNLVSRYEDLYRDLWSKACEELMERHGEAFAMDLLCCIFVASFKVAQEVAKEQRSRMEKMLVNLINFSFAPCQRDDFIQKLQNTCTAEAGEIRRGKTNHPLVDAVLDHVKFKQCSLAAEDLEPLQKVFVERFRTDIKMFMDKFYPSETAMKRTSAPTGTNVGNQFQTTAQPHDEISTSTGSGCQNPAQSEGTAATPVNEYGCQDPTQPDDGISKSIRPADCDQTDLSTLFDGKFARAFKDQCIELAWYMNVQTPPMFIDYLQKGSVRFDKNVHDKYSGEGDYVTKCIWPTLYDNKGGAVAVKGKFVCSATGPGVSHESRV